MKKYIYLALFCSLTISCNQNSSQVEGEYIKNLEEKNKILEEELQEIKNQTGTNNSDIASITNSKNSANYFIIGSTEDEVLEIMGEPTSYIETAPEAKKFLYGLSTVYFYKGKVISFDNLEENLKVRVKKK